MENIEWLKSRQETINASEIASILSIYLPEKYGHFYSYSNWSGGETPYTTKYQLLWQKKLNEEQLELWQIANDNDNTKRGKKEESKIIEKFCQENDFTLQNTQQRIIKNGFAATLDAVVKDIFDAVYVLEVKSIKDNYGLEDKIKRYQLQVQMQLYCSDIAGGYLYFDVYNKNETHKVFVELQDDFVADIEIAKKMFLDDFANIESIKPDFSIKKDNMLYCLIIGEDVENSNLTVDAAIILSEGLKNFAKLYETAKDFLKDNLTEEAYVYGNKKYYCIQNQNTLWTADAITQELNKLQSIKIGDVKRQGSRLVKSIKI